MRKSEVLADTKKMLSDLVYNMTAHEGNPMTQPEVHTLVIDGVTVGGHRISDSDQVRNIAAGWRELIRLIETDEFRVNKETITHLHGIYAKEEALDWGTFRERQVTISGTEYLPPHHTELDDLFVEMTARYEREQDEEFKSYHLFLDCARNQFFNDGNKRAGQYLMNGARLMQGLPIITIAARKVQDYNSKMIRFYDTNDSSEMIGFLKKCRVNVQTIAPQQTQPSRGRSR